MNMNYTELGLAVEVVNAYLLTNKDYIEDESKVLNIQGLLGTLMEEQRLSCRTIMCTILNRVDIKFDDITVFYDTQVLLDNEVEPDVLQTVAQLMYPNDDVTVIGYSSYSDTEYWMETLISSFNGKDDLRRKCMNAYLKFVRENR